MSFATRIRITLGMLVLAVAVPGVAAASAEQAANVPGVWICNERLPDGREVVTENSYSADGTFAGKSSLAGKESWTYSGKWRLVDGQLISEYEKSSKPLALSARTAADQVVVLAGGVMVVASGETGQRTYLRAD